MRQSLLSQNHLCEHLTLRMCVQNGNLMVVDPLPPVDVDGARERRLTSAISVPLCRAQADRLYKAFHGEAAVRPAPVNGIEQLSSRPGL